MQARASALENTSNAQVKTEGQQSTQTQPNAVNYSLKGVRIGAVGAGVAVSLYPFDLTMHWLHTRDKTGTKINPTVKPSISAVTWMVIAGLGTSAKLATAKNMVLTHREDIRGTVNKTMFDEKGNPIEHDLKAEEAQASTSTQLKQDAVVGVVIGGVDTMVSLAMGRNKKTWQMNKITDPLFIIPTPIGIAQRAKANSFGAPALFVRNFGTVAGFLAVPYIQAGLDKNLGENKYNSIGATIVAAAVSAPFTNAIDIINKNQLRKVTSVQTGNKVTFSVPVIKEVMKEMYAKEGIRGFTRGYFASIVYTGAAYFMIPKIEEAVGTYVLPTAEVYITKMYHAAKGYAKSFSMFSASRAKAETPDVAPAPAAEIKTAPVNTPRQ